MKDERLHNLYLHFQELPISRRILYTGTLLVLGPEFFFLRDLMRDINDIFHAPHYFALLIFKQPGIFKQIDF